MNGKTGQDREDKIDRMSPTEKTAMEPEQTVNDDEIFDGIMNHVGLKGYFQKRFNITFNLIYVMFVSLLCMNYILILTVPDHWCFVPGRNATNYTIEEWKEMTIPRNDKNDSYSQCSMFNASYRQPTEGDAHFLPASDPQYTTECQYGWEYDTTWYELTIPSQNDWVCEEEMKVTNTYAVVRIAEVFGTIIFGQLGDTLGRRPVFFIALLLLYGGRLVSAVFSHSYMLFVAANFFASLAATPAFQSSLVISMEVSASDKRAHIAMMQCLGWTAGICLMPMVAWITTGWLSFLLWTTLPCGVFFFMYRQFPESPRWLASRGKSVKCLKVLQYICNVNGTRLPDDALTQLRRLEKTREKTYGFASLFSSRRLAINTIIICISWVVCALSYHVIVLNVTNMAGNPYMNFFWQSLIELPAYVFGSMLSDRYGRRWTQVFILFTVPVCCVILMLVVTVPDLEWLCMVLVVTTKMSITMAFYVVYLQALEIYPTCVRQTGTSCGSLVANTLGVLSPYIVYLGTAVDIRYPYGILAALSFVGGICVAFLPETLHQKLPETLIEAQHFGEDQPFWNFRYSPIAKKDENEPTKKNSVA